MNRGIFIGLSMAVLSCLISVLLLIYQPMQMEIKEQTPPLPFPVEEAAPTEPPAETVLVSYDRTQKLAKAMEEGSEVVGWLVVPGTDIDEPVTHTYNNDYYLVHDWKGNYDQWGAYFGDYINDFTSRETLSHNNMIYGHSHNAEDWTLPGFTQLFHFNDIDFLREHPCFYLYLANGEELTFQIVGAFYTDIWFDYINPEPEQEPGLDYYNVVKSKNEYLFDGIDFGPEDKLMTLSTCSYKYDTRNSHNHRYVVLGKLLEEGQLPVTVEVRRNPDAVHPNP